MNCSKIQLKKGCSIQTKIALALTHLLNRMGKGKHIPVQLKNRLGTVK